MTVVTGQSLFLFHAGVIQPWSERTLHEETGTTFGVSLCGYDVRIDQDLTVWPQEFYLASTVEKFTMPRNLMAVVHDKSTWARRGLALQNTVIEPGWIGFLTLEITNHHRYNKIHLPKGSPIAQIVFHELDRTLTQGYDGKYQNQKRGPQEAL